MYIHNKTRWQGISVNPNIQVDGEKPQEPKDLCLLVSLCGESRRKQWGGLMDLRKGKPQNIQQVRKTAVNKHSLERAAGQFKNSSWNWTKFYLQQQWVQGLRIKIWKGLEHSSPRNLQSWFARASFQPRAPQWGETSESRINSEQDRDNRDMGEKVQIQVTEGSRDRNLRKQATIFFDRRRKQNIELC